MENISIFIDGSNFYHGMRHCFGSGKNIDFQKFSELLSGGRNLIRIYYYNVPVRRQDGEERYKSQQKFFRKLYDIPYMEIKLGRLERQGDKMIEKGVDVNLAVDMLTLAYKNVYDTAILVSGDGDFAAAVNVVKDIGKHVENAYFWKGHSDELYKVCDKFIRLTPKFLKGCLF